jgi:membrane AbrB-like protein
MPAVGDLRRWRDEAFQGFVLLAIGTLGATVARGVGLPGGAVVGALLAVGAVQVAWPRTGIRTNPSQKRLGRIGRLALGTVVGAAFSAQVLAPLKAAVLPMVIVVTILAGVGFFNAWILFRFGRATPETAILGGVPGGLPAMAGLSSAMRADSTVVAAIHVARLTSIVLIVPNVVRLLLPASPAGLAPETITGAVEAVSFWHSVLTLVVGMLAGLLVARLGFPSGELVGPILVVGTANVLGAGLGPLSDNVRQVAMILLGTAVGSEISKESLRGLRAVALPAAASVAMLVGTGLLLGWGLHLVAPIDLATAMMGCSPGGASTMAAVAGDLGADMRIVAALQLVRQLVVLLLVPVVAQAVLAGKWLRRASPF